MKHLNDQYFDGNRLREVGAPVAGADAANKAYVDYCLEARGVRIYRNVTGTAAVTSSPYTHAKWDVMDSDVTEYYDGMVVCVKVPVAGSSYGVGLQINSLGYKPVVYNVNSMISTRYSVGAVVWAVYNSTQTAALYEKSASASTITGCWQVMDCDSNTTAINNLVKAGGARLVTADLLRYAIAFRKDETAIVPIHSNAGTGTYASTCTPDTTKTMTTESFDPFGEIYYYATNTKVDTNTAVAMNLLNTQRNALDARYIFNCGKTLTANRELYLVVDLQSDGKVKLAETPWSQTLPTTNDGHLYILLGFAYSTYQFELYYHHPIYYHNGTRLYIYSGDKTFSGSYNDLADKPAIPTIPANVSAFTNDAGYITANDIPSGSGGNSDFTHTTNTTVSTSTVAVTFAENTRGSRMISVSDDINIQFTINNLSDNYLWIKNTGNADIDVTIDYVQHYVAGTGNVQWQNVYVPTDGISVPAGKVCEIGIICNSDAVFITSRNDLSL